MARILVVDDDRELLEMMRTVLERGAVAAEQNAQIDGGEQPFVWIDDNRIGPLAPVQYRPLLRQYGRGPGVRGVDVQPHPVIGAYVGDGVDGVNAGR